MHVTATAANKSSGIACFAVDLPGTSLVTSDLLSKSIAFTAEGGWEGPLAESEPGKFEASTTITLVGVIESKVTSTMGVACNAVGTGTTAVAALSAIVATQVASITS
jgi:hypothetical protein